MKKLGFVLGAIGALIVFASFGMDTAPEGTHNIGLMQSQLMTLQLGGLAVLVGVLLAVVGTVLSRMEDAGVLPIASIKVGDLPSDAGSTERA